MDLLLSSILVLAAGFIGLLYGLVHIVYGRLSNKEEYIEPEELADRYIEQKRNPDAHTPEVRMIVLNNHGLSFTELITHRI